MELANTHIMVVTNSLAKYLQNTPYFSSIASFDNNYQILTINNAKNQYVVPLTNKAYSVSDL